MVSDFEMQRYSDKKIRVCDKNSIPFLKIAFNTNDTYIFKLIIKKLAFEKKCTAMATHAVSLSKYKSILTKVYINTDIFKNLFLTFLKFPTSCKKLFKKSFF